jgi:hypothetical protein
MPEHLPYDDDAIFNPETHHEKSDVNVRALLWAVVIFVIFALVTHLLLWLLFKGFAKLATSQNKPALTSMKVPESMSVPGTNMPRLQPFPSKTVAPYRDTPVVDLDEMRRGEQEAQTQPAWIDREKGTVRLPIDVAKQLVLQRGLPVAAEPPATPAATTTTASAPAATTTITTTTGGATQ